MSNMFAFPNVTQHIPLQSDNLETSNEYYNNFSVCQTF